MDYTAILTGLAGLALGAAKPIAAALCWEPVYYWRKVKFEKGLRIK